MSPCCSKTGCMTCCVVWSRLCCAGFADRLAAELASLRPPGQPMAVHMSAEPLLDTWRGAAALAAGGNSSSSAVAALFGDPFAPGSWAMTRQQYEEAGMEYLRECKGFSYPQL